MTTDTKLDELERLAKATKDAEQNSVKWWQAFDAFADKTGPDDILALIARIRELERELSIAKGNNAARLDGLSSAIATLERAQVKFCTYANCQDAAGCKGVCRAAAPATQQHTETK